MATAFMLLWDVEECGRLHLARQEWMWHLWVRNLDHTASAGPDALEGDREIPSQRTEVGM